MKNNGKVRDVRSLTCKIKVLNGRVPGSWKWTIAAYLIHDSRWLQLTLSVPMDIATVY